MLDRNAAMAHHREVLDGIDRLDSILDVLKTDGGHLSSAGVEFINVGLERGMKQVQLAALLQVSAAAVNYHAKAAAA